LRALIGRLVAALAFVASASGLALHGVAAWALPQQDARDPAGAQAAHIHGLWQLMWWACAAVFVLLVAAAWLAVLRRRRHALEAPDLYDSPAQSRRITRVVAVAVAVSAVSLMGLIVASVSTDRALAALPHDDALHIEVTAHQWWWEAVYDDADPSRTFTTANELHIPVGRTVMFTLKADDVIHSLWIPNLHGKKDLIPGRVATHALRADRAGIYRGQCAEFCGYQHAWMGLLVIAEPSDAYARWADQQRKPAPPPVTPQAAAGLAVLETGTCAMCHAVQGTKAGARKAPDLTHVASRMTLGAVALDNTPANRAAWIEDPQQFKPGVNMPPHPLAPADLGALLAYLDTLQ
jgi:cytochrome c oxidase subunit 2